MNIANVMAELATNLGAVSGLRVYPYNVDSVSAPSAIIGLPEEVTYDETFRRGADSAKLEVYVFVARIDQRTGSKALAAYLDGSGSKSVKAALDSSDTVHYATCDVVRVAKATVEPLQSGGIEYLGAVFTLEITGQGA